MFDTGAVISQLSSAFPHFASLPVAEEPQTGNQQHAMPSLSEADAEILLDSINVPQLGLLSARSSNNDEGSVTKKEPLDLPNVSSSEHSDGSSSSSDENELVGKEGEELKPRRSTRSGRSSGSTVA